MKNKIFVILFLVIIYSLCLMNIFSKKEDVSYNERRKLAKMPEMGEEEYSNKLEKYALDHFVFRDGFRSLKAKYNYYIMNKLENNDIVLTDKSIYKIEYPTNYESIDNYFKYINKMENLFNNNNVYILIVPDKNYYLNKYIKIDYDYIYSKRENIDIRNILNENDYYETDLHWKQENLEKVVKVICDRMNLPYKKIDYKENVYDKFYGIYYGESAVINKPEKIKYLTNDIIDKSKVTYLENNKLNSVYNINKLSSFDSYEVYLDGSSSFIEIENENSLTNRELIVFRDSFGSSLAPLLIPYYKKITLIDNRYISSNYFNDKVVFDKQDVLFINSTLLVNKSNTLKG